jgi:tetratricopeptide (TPR) repeat protein
MQEAHTYVGYAQRKLGRNDKALAAYERALRIDPHYPFAIEYQGEAYHGLDRPEEARVNYMRLYALDPRHASKLFLALRAWVDANRARPPRGIDVTALDTWLSERAASIEQDAATRAASAW